MRRNIIRISVVVASVAVFERTSAASASRPMECAHPRWFDRWQTGGIKPGVAWDMGTPSPALQQALDSGTIPEGRGRTPHLNHNILNKITDSFDTGLWTRL